MEQFGQKINKRDKKGFLATMAVEFRHQTEKDHLQVWGLMWRLPSFLPRPVDKIERASDRMLDAGIDRESIAWATQSEIMTEINRLVEGFQVSGFSSDDRRADYIAFGDVYDLTIIFFEGEWFFGDMNDALSLVFPPLKNFNKYAFRA